MTQPEFSKGWRLLINQPWGWRYKSVTPTGQPTEESKTQLEFYYTHLSFGHALAWMKVADLFAQGETWPSVSVLKAALLHANASYVKAIDAPTNHYEPMPPEVKEQLARIGRPMPEGKGARGDE